MPPLTPTTRAWHKNALTPRVGAMFEGWAAHVLNLKNFYDVYGHIDWSEFQADSWEGPMVINPDLVTPNGRVVVEVKACQFPHQFKLYQGQVERYAEISGSGVVPGDMFRDDVTGLRVFYLLVVHRSRQKGKKPVLKACDGYLWEALKRISATTSYAVLIELPCFLRVLEDDAPLWEDLTWSYSPSYPAGGILRLLPPRVVANLAELPLTEAMESVRAHYGAQVVTPAYQDAVGPGEWPRVPITILADREIPYDFLRGVSAPTEQGDTDAETEEAPF